MTAPLKGIVSRATLRATVARMVAEENLRGLRIVLGHVETKISQAELIGWRPLAESWEQDKRWVTAQIHKVIEQVGVAA